MAPKVKRLMEDESLRELVCLFLSRIFDNSSSIQVCSKLNLGLEHKMSEEDFVKEIVCDSMTLRNTSRYNFSS